MIIIFVIIESNHEVFDFKIRFIINL